jgi:hypothetical protein
VLPWVFAVVAVTAVVAAAVVAAVVAAASVVFAVLDHSFMVVYLTMDNELHWDP